MSAKDMMKTAFADCGKFPHWDTILRDAMHVLHTTKWGPAGNQDRIAGICDALRRRKCAAPPTPTADQLEAINALIVEAAAENEKRRQALVDALRSVNSQLAEARLTSSKS